VTPLEEVISVQEQLNKLKLSTQALKDTLRTKDESYNKFIESAKA